MQGSSEGTVTPGSGGRSRQARGAGTFRRHRLWTLRPPWPPPPGWGGQGSPHRRALAAGLAGLGHEPRGTGAYPEGGRRGHRNVPDGQGHMCKGGGVCLLALDQWLMPCWKQEGQAEGRLPRSDLCPDSLPPPPAGPPSGAALADLLPEKGPGCVLSSGLPCPPTTPPVSGGFGRRRTRFGSSSLHLVALRSLLCSP